MTATFTACRLKGRYSWSGGRSTQKSDVATGTWLGALTGADSAVWSLAFGDGDVLAAATGWGAVLRWDLSFAGLVEAVCERGVRAEEWPTYFDGVPDPCTSGG